MYTDVFASAIQGLKLDSDLHFFKAGTFPTIRPIHWLTSHFAVGGFSPLQRLSGMLTAHMTQIATQICGSNIIKRKKYCLCLQTITFYVVRFRLL